LFGIEFYKSIYIYNLINNILFLSVGRCLDSMKINRNVFYNIIDSMKINRNVFYNIIDTSKVYNNYYYTKPLIK
jgi:hypothetical protein